MLNIDLEKATFIKNKDNTYRVYQPIGSGILKLPKVIIEIKAEALEDETGNIFQWIDGEEKRPFLSRFIRKIVPPFLVRR